MKYTDGKNIPWNDIDIETDIDWDNIQFLTHEETDNGIVIKRLSNIPQIGGLYPILAYRGNFLRYLKQFVGGEEIANSLDQGLLWDMSLTLSRGGVIPFSTRE